uniref:Chromosome 1 open reading frame 226 n=1 Tax=Catagonus wagneri TaxID=51154 RepID=A0A8C3VXV1_9CETA
MFENLNTALTPKLQSSRSFPHLSRPAAPSSAASGSVEPGGPGLWVGSSQHLKNLGKAMGAKVNDFLRRKEPSSLGSVGTTEVNKTAGAQLAGGADVGDGRSALQEAFPRLDPPPPITRKRTPRALKTTQDMLISPQPVLSSLECGTELPPGQPQDFPAPAQPLPAGASQPEATVEMGNRGEAVPNGEVSLSVPDLIHKDSQDEPTLKTTECRRASFPGVIERNGLQLSLSPSGPAESLEHSSPPPQARTSSLDNEGPHPDLLSFE